MKISLTISDLSLNEAKGVIHLIHGTMDGTMSVHQVEDEPVQTPSEEEAPRSGEQQGADLDQFARMYGAEGHLAEPPVEMHTPPGQPESATEAELARLTKLYDGQWKPTATIQVDGMQHAIEDEVCVAGTGEIVVIQRLYRGRALVLHQNGAVMLYESRDLRPTPERLNLGGAAPAPQQRSATPAPQQQPAAPATQQQTAPSHLNGAGRPAVRPMDGGGGPAERPAPQQTEPEEVTSEADLRALCEQVVQMKTSAPVLNLMDELGIGRVPVSKVKAADRDRLAAGLRKLIAS